MGSIKDQDYGVMTIEKNQCRGVDTKFAKDALVIITFIPSDYNEYQQMLGRASRTRSVCEGTMLTSSYERTS